MIRMPSLSEMINESPNFGLVTKLERTLDQTIASTNKVAYVTKGTTGQTVNKLKQELLKLKKTLSLTTMVPHENVLYGVMLGLHDAVLELQGTDPQNAALPELQKEMTEITQIYQEISKTRQTSQKKQGSLAPVQGQGLDDI